ncbi:MAG: hypothetical protein K5654_03170 [Lachnospiraceae bacterium]|nr:hypothetical protein [Lachnospiraceae bacterium]
MFVFLKKMTLFIEEAAALSGLGQNYIESLLRMPDCPFLYHVNRDGCAEKRRKRVIRVPFERFIIEHPG